MRVLITGATGQLGVALASTAPESITVIPTDHSTLDISNAASIWSSMVQHCPHLVINCAAMTNLDAAERDPNAAHVSNAMGPHLLALACSRMGIRMIHLSTDAVFSGPRTTPWTPHDSPLPLSAYAKSKYAGEIAVQRILGDSSTIVRTSWLYGSHGHNFVKTMLTLMHADQPIRVVNDQYGSPTWTMPLATCLWKMVARPTLSGIWHWSDLGGTTWYEFACAIREDAQAIGLIASAPLIVPISTAEYGSRVPRPPYSVLDSHALAQQIGIPLTPWRDNLRTLISSLKLLG